MNVSNISSDLVEGLEVKRGDEGILRHINQNKLKYIRLVVPNTGRRHVFRLAHYERIEGYPGQSYMLYSLRGY